MWIVIIESPNGNRSERSVKATDVDDACAQVRATIPLMWRVVSAQRRG